MQDKLLNGLKTFRMLDYNDSEVARIGSEMESLGTRSTSRIPNPNNAQGEDV